MSRTILSWSECLVDCLCICPVQRQAIVQSSAVMNKMLMNIPDASLTEHDCNMLSLMGSVQQLSAATVDDILEHTDLDMIQ